jgi:hypothetical protein
MTLRRWLRLRLQPRLWLWLWLWLRLWLWLLLRQCTIPGSYAVHFHPLRWTCTSYNPPHAGLHVKHTRDRSPASLILHSARRWLPRKPTCVLLISTLYAARNSVCFHLHFIQHITNTSRG